MKLNQKFREWINLTEKLLFDDFADDRTPSNTHVLPLPLHACVGQRCGNNIKTTTKHDWLNERIWSEKKGKTCSKMSRFRTSARSLVFYGKTFPFSYFTINAQQTTAQMRAKCFRFNRITKIVIVHKLRIVISLTREYDDKYAATQRSKKRK